MPKPGLRERLLAQVADGVRVHSPRPAAAHVPEWYAGWLRDMRLAGHGLAFARTPALAAGRVVERYVEPPEQRAQRLKAAARRAAADREADRAQADEPGAETEDDWGFSCDEPSALRGGGRRPELVRLDLEDQTLVTLPTGSRVPVPHELAVRMQEHRARSRQRFSLQDWLDEQDV